MSLIYQTQPIHFSAYMLLKNFFRIPQSLLLKLQWDLWENMAHEKSINLLIKNFKKSYIHNDANFP